MYLVCTEYRDRNHEKSTYFRLKVRIFPHEPWQNGKTENHIKVLCNIARTHMVASGLAGRSWARAIAYAADISNVHFEADLKMSLFEALHKQKPNLSHFQPFGVECWVLFVLNS
jgi:hypothetical protein